VNEITMTLKVSSAFRDLLTALVEARAAELEERRARPKTSTPTRTPKPKRSKKP
jgi:hypothetical protein